MQTHKRYVAHFDMLGFKTATLRNQDEAWGALSDLETCMSTILDMHLEILSTGELLSNRIKAHIFSDTVLIYTFKGEPKDLLSIIILTAQLFAESLQHSVPLRGGISYGDFFLNLDKSLFCGVPFVRAYELGEMGQWSGIVLDERVAEHYFKNQGNMPLPSTHVIEWNIPIKPKGEKKCWVVNWPYIFQSSFTKKPPISVQDYYEAFESMFGPYDDLPGDVKAKYQNTVDFINSSITEGGQTGVR